MSKWKKLLAEASSNPKSVRFSDLKSLVERMGYELARQRGSHLQYRRAGHPAITLQSDGSMAKPYQVRQVLEILETYNISV